MIVYGRAIRGIHRYVVIPALCLVLGACGSTTSLTATPAGTSKLARWTPFVHVKRPLDLVGPRGKSMVLAADGRLWLLTRSGAVRGFASAYSSPGGEEPYIALARAHRNGCSFGAGAIYAIRLQHGRGITEVTPSQHVRRFASITAPGLIDGIAFDDTGNFGHRLLVTINAGKRTTVDAISCQGALTTITRHAPRVEGGIAVAPASFGRFAGDLIAPDETGGRIYAVTPQGKSLLVANSGLPHGGDVGVESETFVPSRRHFDVLVADRLTPGNPHPGDDVVLQITSGALRAAGVRSGDLLVATEGGAHTDALSCTQQRCRVRHVADGPAIAHVEGHIAVMP